MPDFNRNSSFLDLYAKYKTLGDEAKQKNFTGCIKGRKSYAAHSKGSPRLGPYMEILERTRKAKHGPVLYGTHINDQFNRYEIYVSNLKKVSRSCPDLKAKLKGSWCSAAERGTGTSKQFNASSALRSNVPSVLQQTPAAQVKAGENILKNRTDSCVPVRVRLEESAYRQQANVFPNENSCRNQKKFFSSESSFKKCNLSDRNQSEFDQNIHAHSEFEHLATSKIPDAFQNFDGQIVPVQKERDTHSPLEKPQISCQKVKGCYDDKSRSPFLTSKNTGCLPKTFEVFRDNDDRSENMRNRNSDVYCMSLGCKHLRCPAASANHLTLSPGSLNPSTNDKYTTGAGEGSFENFTSRDVGGHFVNNPTGNEQSVCDNQLKVELRRNHLPENESDLNPSECKQLALHTLYKDELRKGELTILGAHLSRNPVPGIRPTDIYTQRSRPCHVEERNSFDGSGKGEEITNLASLKFKDSLPLIDTHRNAVSLTRDMGQKYEISLVGSSYIGKGNEGRAESVNNLHSGAHVSSPSRLSSRQLGILDSSTHIKQLECSGRKNAVFEKAVQEEIVNRGLLKNRQLSPSLLAEESKPDRNVLGSSQLEGKDQQDSVSKDKRNVPSSQTSGVAIGSSMPNLLEYRKALWSHSLLQASSSLSGNLCKSSENCFAKSPARSSSHPPKSFSFSQLMLADDNFAVKQGSGEKQGNFHAPLRSQQYSCESLENIVVKNGEVLAIATTPLGLFGQRKEGYSSSPSNHDYNYAERTSPFGKNVIPTTSSLLDNDCKKVAHADKSAKSGLCEVQKTPSHTESLDVDFLKNTQKSQDKDFSDGPLKHASNEKYPGSCVSEIVGTGAATCLDPVHKMEDANTATDKKLQSVVRGTVSRGLKHHPMNGAVSSLSVDHLNDSRGSGVQKESVVLKKASSVDLGTAKTRTVDFMPKTVNKLYEFETNKQGGKSGERVNPIVASVRAHRTQCRLVPDSSVCHNSAQKPPPYQDLIGRNKGGRGNGQNKTPDDTLGVSDALHANINQHEQGNPNTFTVLNKYIHDIKQGVSPWKGEKDAESPHNKPSPESSPPAPAQRSPHGSWDRRRRDEADERRRIRVQQITEEEKKKKAIQEQLDAQARRHSDYFTPAQKSPIPTDRFDKYQGKNMKKKPEIHGKARALYNFSAQSPRELSFRKGDIILLIKKVDKNWFEGEHHGKTGLFPVNYVEVITSVEAAHLQDLVSEGQAVAKFNFTAQTKVEMSVKKGEVVVLIRRVDENWYEAKIGSRHGIVPVSYLEVVREPTKRAFSPISVSSSHPMSPVNYNGPLSPTPGAPARPQQPVSWSPTQRSASPSSQTRTQYSPQSSPRTIHARSIVTKQSSPPHDQHPGSAYSTQTWSPTYRSASPRDYTDAGGRPAQNRVAPPSGHSGSQPQSFSTQTWTGGSPSLVRATDVHRGAPDVGYTQEIRAPSPTTFSSITMSTSVKDKDKKKKHIIVQPAPISEHQTSVNLQQTVIPQQIPVFKCEGEDEFLPYQAVYPYHPQNEDELELKEKDIVYVMEKCDDGWFVGTCVRTGQFGTFPGNYVEPV
ncbi:uncharacterized protein LOC106177644 isoform X2 [Lingula anatina]|nr:uncharacterized protein LOC106177644 isoform X2 [Lingula anatina]|eukprot:XP_013416047.1 uncharacterized protein LOC106177644 isoform X2 [Lingula anatina]